MEPNSTRRLTTLDAMVLVAMTALALVRGSEVWPDAWEIFRRVNLAHFDDSGFLTRNFSAQPQTGRMDSIEMLSRDMVRPFRELSRPTRTFRKRDGTQAAPEEWLENWIITRTNWGTGGGAVGYAAAGEAYVLAFPFLLIWTIGLIPLRLRRPRPERGELWRQPGWWACVAAVAGYFAGLAEEALIECPAPTVIVPAAVLLARLALALSRKWSAEPSWIDRAGR